MDRQMSEETRAAQVAELLVRMVKEKRDRDPSDYLIIMEQEAYGNGSFMAKICSHFTRKVLTESGYDKTEVLKRIQDEFRFSPVLLDGFLDGIYQHNTSITGYNQVVSFINKDIPKMNWSCLTSPSLLQLGQLKSGPCDQCIFEVVLRSSRPHEIANSEFAHMKAGSLFSLLSETARNNFADGILVRGPLTAICDKLENSCSEFVTAVFRKRDDFDIVRAAFSAEGVDNFNDIMMKIYSKFISKDSNAYEERLFTFFVAAVLPNVDLIADDFLHTLINSPNFPSEDPDFPAVEFLSCDRCMHMMTTKIFFDLLFPDADIEFVSSLFHVLINSDPAPIFEQILSRCTEQMKPMMEHLFLYYLKNSDVVCADTLSYALGIFLMSFPDILCEFCTEAVVQEIRLDLLLSPSILSIFLDYAYQSPVPALGYLLQCTMRYQNFDEIIAFWKSPLTAAAVANASMDGWKYMTEFMLEIAQNAGEVLVHQFCKFVKFLPSGNKFEMICRSRFDQESPVILSLNKL